MTHSELNGRTGTWKEEYPAIIASDGPGYVYYVLQNRNDGAKCSEKLRSKYPQFKYSWALVPRCKSDDELVDSEFNFEYFKLDSIPNMLTWKSVKKFNL
jgi:hypothetical protein